MILYGVFYVVGSVHYFMENVVICEEAKGKFSGLSVTLLLSISNLSRLTVWQKLLMDQIAYNSCIWNCLCYGVALNLMLPVLGRWLQRGESSYVRMK